MDDLVAKTSIGGLFGAGGLLAGWFGLRAKVKCVENRIDEVAKDVRYKDTCDEIASALRVQLEDIKKINTETGRDVKKLLERGCGGK